MKMFAHHWWDPSAVLGKVRGCSFGTYTSKHPLFWNCWDLTRENYVQRKCVFVDVDCPSCLLRLIRAALQLCPPCSHHLSSLRSAFSRATRVLITVPTNVLIQNKQWEAATKQLQSSAKQCKAGCCGSWCRREFAAVVCLWWDHECIQLALRSFVLGAGHGDCVLRHGLGVMGISHSLRCLVAALGGFGGLDLEHSEEGVMLQMWFLQERRAG